VPGELARVLGAAVLDNLSDQLASMEINSTLWLSSLPEYGPDCM
jgi:hypothetical protein